MSRREQTKAANLAAILDAGRRVFGDVGYGAASVRDIIRSTELAAGTFYNYFPDKGSIFAALVEEIGVEARARVRAARKQATTLESFVEDGFRAYFEFIVEDPSNLAFVTRNAGMIRSLSDGQVPMGTEELAEDLHAAIAAGLLRPVDVGYAAPVMIAVGIELGLRLLERDPPDVEGATRFAGELLLRGLQGSVNGSTGSP